MRTFYSLVLAILFVVLNSYASAAEVKFIAELGVKPSVKLAKVFKKNDVLISSKGKIQFTENDEQIVIVSKNKAEVLTINRCCGGSGETRYITVEKNAHSNKLNKINSSSLNQFVTLSGIRLGINKTVLFRLKGRKYEKFNKDGIEKIIYTIADSTDPLLSMNNEAGYEAIFYFKNNELIKYAFGFIEP